MFASTSPDFISDTVATSSRTTQPDQGLTVYACLFLVCLVATTYRRSYVMGSTAEVTKHHCQVLVDGSQGKNYMSCRNDTGLTRWPCGYRCI